MSKCSSLNIPRALSVAEPEIWAFSSSVRLAPRTLPAAISLMGDLIAAHLFNGGIASWTTQVPKERLS